jgi:4-hydroxybenzoate polyprenyltransferase
VNRTRQSWVGALRLIRPAGVLTAPADVLAGWCIAGAADWRTLVILSGASACLYAGGMALNDVCDSELDAKERPERPIPSGAVSRKRAALLAVALLVVGVTLAFVSSVVTLSASRLVPEPDTAQQTFQWTTSIPGWVALALAAMIVLYNTLLKHNALIGPISMAACRSLNLALGMSVSASALAVWWPVALLPGVYIAGVTVMARDETEEKPNRAGIVAMTTGLIAATVGWAAIAILSDRVDAMWMLPLLAVFAAAVGSAVFRVWRQPGSKTVQRAVGRAILGLVVLDAAIAAGFASPVYGGVALALLGASTLTARRFAIT